MSDVKERIIGAVTVMNEQEATKIWELIVNTFAKKEWESIPTESPDEIDLSMLTDIKTNPECQEFVSSEEAMKMLDLQ